MSSKNNLTEENIIMILYNLLCAIKTLHASNIIIRDLKPEHILINDSCQIKLLCAGLERTLPSSHIGSGSGNSKRIRDSIYQQNLKDKYDDERIKEIIAKKVRKIKSDRGDNKRCLSPLVGSCKYRAPEISIQEEKYDQSADMWSLGCILYEQMKFLNQIDLQKMTCEQRKSFE